ncbi:MAG: hypothetical protein AAB610_01250 [Patescibacteria group bacterium]
MMNNPALANLERELKDEEAKLNQKKIADREMLEKNVALNSEIRAHEEAIRIKKAEIAKLELEIRTEGNDIKKNALAETALKGEIRSLDQKRAADSFKLMKMARDFEDARKKEEKEKRIHPDLRNN